MEKHRKISVALNTVPGLRAAVYHRALAAAGSPGGILEAGRKGRLARLGTSPAVAAAVAGLDVDGRWAEETETAAAAGVRIITLDDEGYPANLRQIADPPPVLYIRGEITGEDAEAIAVVGSRAATGYGRATAAVLSRELASRGVTVVSGLARGIDSSAHHGALEVGGRTIAVLGSGMDCVYPRENRPLAESVARSGAVVTEFPFRSQPDRWHFPLRNRIISGLALGVVVVEAAARSGALITGRLALEQNREVFAVPGNISSPVSAGPNSLISDGAKLVSRVEDILEEFPRLAGREPVQLQLPQPLSKEESSLMSHLGSEPVAVDDLIRRSALPSARALSLLTALELKGLVDRQAGRGYVRH
jgi:DNA processing protein